MLNLLKELLKNKRAATAIEYGLITALIAVPIIVALQKTGFRLEMVYCIIGNALGGNNPLCQSTS